MKDPPSWLPPLNSRKWHSRALNDPLGRLRVRALANPRWQRDTAGLVRVLRVYRRDAAESLYPLVDEAIAAVRRYPKTALGFKDEAAAWDEVLLAWDKLLEGQQARRLAIRASRTAQPGRHEEPDLKIRETDLAP